MQIKIPVGSFPIYPLVRASKKNDEWVIIDVELYADAERTVLIADDLAAKLPTDSINAVYHALDEHDAKTRMISRKLMREMARHEVILDPTPDQLERAFRDAL